MALRARVLPALAGSLSSAFGVKKASGMDEAPMPAAPPTAQPRADATSCINAEASKRMRMARAKAIPYRRRFVVAEFLCSLWNRDQNTFESSVFFVDGVRLSQIGFVATGALSRGCGSHLGFPT
jgi:hypothetical protein